MQQAFVIMQIGNPELDEFYSDILVPTLTKCNLNVKRVDKHNEGNLLKSEIVNFIESSDIILADLTNERPNCYLEVGYTMGLNKFQNLILTAREDHLPESPNYKQGGPKIHFDLLGYDIIFWDKNDLDEFEEKLEKGIKRRLNLIKSKEGDNRTEVSFVDSAKDYIRTGNEIEFHELIKGQMKTIETNWFKLYENINSEFSEKQDVNVVIEGLKEFETYIDDLTEVGLTLVEYSHRYLDKFLSVLTNIYELSDILFEGQGNFSYNRMIRYLPRAALYNIYCCLGACAIKNEKLDVLKKLIKIEMTEEDYSLPISKPVWLNSDIFYPPMFSDGSVGIFKFLYDSYEYKEFVNKFFRSQEEFLKYLCQFNLILCLYCAKMHLENPELHYWIYPAFSNFSGHGLNRVMPLFLKIKSDGYLSTMFPQTLFGEAKDVFIQNYPQRCAFINNIIRKNRTSIFNIYELPCDIFNRSP